MSFLSGCYFCFVVLLVTVMCDNYAPVIGVLTLPCNDSPSMCPSWILPDATTYLPRQYVEWLESGGATVVPLFADDTLSNTQNKLSQLNGVLFTGGAAHIYETNDIWWNQLDNIMSYLIRYNNKNNNNEAIPLWSTCLGFQAMLSWTAGEKIISSRQAQEIMLSVEFINSTFCTDDSLIFGNDIKQNIPKQFADIVYTKLETETLTYNHHNYGVDPSDWQKYKYLNNNFSLLAISKDSNDKNMFVTLVESYKNTGLYWYGSQFHPEIPEYIYFHDTNITTGFDAMMINTYFSQFFVNECRMRNNNVMDDKTYNKSVIYNYNTHFINDHNYDMNYIFAKPK